MAWTAPRTWVTGETPTAAIFNAHVRDNLSFLGAPPSVRAYNNANISVSNNSLTALTLNSERWDTDTMHDTGSNTSRLTCFTAGYFLIIGCVRFASNATGVRAASIRLNGSTEIAREQQSEVAASQSIFCVSCFYPLAVADYVELMAFQTSGGSLNVESQSAYSPEFMAIWMSN